MSQPGDPGTPGGREDGKTGRVDLFRWTLAPRLDG